MIRHRRPTPRIEVKTPDQLRAMRRAGLVVCRALREMAAAATPGTTTAEIDQVARQVLASAGATSSFLGYDIGYGVPPYPATICISVNEQVVHGIPSGQRLADGDLVSIDFGAIVDGFHGDSAVTVEVGTTSPEASALSAATRTALWAGLAAARPRCRVGDISAAVERSVRDRGLDYGIVAEYTGHGIGSRMHMDPDVPNLGRSGRGPRLLAWIAVAVEPILTLGRPQTEVLDDGWTVVTIDRGLACHWEHTVVLTEHGIWVTTAEDGGEAELGALGAPYAPLAD